MTSHFVTSARTVAQAAQEVGISIDVYDVLSLTEALVRRGAFPEPVKRWENAQPTHENLVAWAEEDEEVRVHLAEGKLINAIKHVRQEFPGFKPGLREAKEAVEDERVKGRWYNRPGFI